MLPRMTTLRIAVASTPLTATLVEAVPAAIAAIEAAGKAGARILCLPEAILPGHRMQKRSVEEVSQAALDAALETLAAAARAAQVVTLVGMERPTPDRYQLVQVVIDASGRRLGEQAKTQVDPSEETVYAPGAQRRVFTAGGATFGLAICHEVFRYPEISRTLARAGAQIIFAPHFVGTREGSLPTQWLDPKGPYNEKALLCRALENTVYVAAANTAGPNQGSASCIIAPDGTLLGRVPYGEVGIVTADIELERATALIAKRWAPERSTTLV